MGLDKTNTNFSNLSYLNALNGASKTVSANQTTKAGEVKPAIQITSSDTIGRTNFSSTVGDILGRAKVNSPAAQGLASAQDIENGQLVSGYYFDNLGRYDSKIFALKYNSANTPSITEGTEYACEGIEYTGVAGNIEAAASKSPFAELFVS